MEKKVQYRWEGNDSWTQSREVRNALNYSCGKGLDWTWQEGERGNNL